MDSQNQHQRDVSQNIDSINENESLISQNGSIGGRSTSSNSTAGGVTHSGMIELDLEAMLKRTRSECQRLTLVINEIETENVKKLLDLALKELQLKLQFEHSKNKLKKLSSDLADLTSKCNAQLAVINKLLQNKLSISSPFECVVIGSNGAPIALSVASVSQETTTYPSTPHLNALPAVPLRIIFSKLSLQDVLQIQCSQVCLAWKCYQEDILSKVPSITLLIGTPVPDSLFYSTNFRNRHLAKIANDDGTPMYAKCQLDDKWFHICYPLLQLDTIRLLVKTLLNLVHLQIILHGFSYEEIENVILLIEQWSLRLITLKLWCSFSEKDCIQLTNKVVKLFDWINSLPVLEHLTVELLHHLYVRSVGQLQKVDFQFLGVKPHIEILILSRLREFIFYSHDAIQHTPLFYCLNQFVSSNRHLNYILIGNRDYTKKFSWFARQSSNVASRITSLPNVGFIEFDPLAVRAIFADFSSLTDVRFVHIPESYTFTQLISSFSSLANLVRLDLFLIFDPNPLGQFNFQFFSDDDRSPVSAISQLASIKILSFSVDINEH